MNRLFLLTLTVFLTSTLLSTSVLANEEGDQTPHYNDCLELPCGLQTETGDYITVNGAYTANEEVVSMDMLVTDQNEDPQLRVVVDYTRGTNHYEAQGTVIRYGDNVFGLPELALKVDQVVPVMDTSTPGFAPVTANEIVALTLLTGLIDTDGSDATSTPCEMLTMMQKENKDCTFTERDPFESSFTLSSFILIPWFEGAGAKECAVKHDVCYENATSQGDRLACDLDLMLCLQTEEPWGAGGHILSWLGISVGGSFVFEPSKDECLCEYTITDAQAKTLAPAGSHDGIFTYKNNCCDKDSNCIVGNECEVVAYDIDFPAPFIRTLTEVLTIKGKCKKNPNYVAPQEMCQYYLPAVDCEGCFWDAEPDQDQ